MKINAQPFVPNQALAKTTPNVKPWSPCKGLHCCENVLDDDVFVFDEKTKSTLDSLDIRKRPSSSDRGIKAGKTIPTTLEELFGNSSASTKDGSLKDGDSISDSLESGEEVPALKYNRSIVDDKKPKMTKNMKSKTIMCRNITLHGHCKFGDECSYAHHESEITVKREMPSNYKTKLCT